MVSGRDAAKERLERERSGQTGGGPLSAEPSPSDEALAQQMFAGDEKAAKLLLERYRRPLYGMLMRLTRNPADAEELFQETFLRALSSSSTFDRSRKFKPWLFAIAVNLSRDRAKRLAHPATPELRAAEELPEPGRTARHDAESPLVRRTDLERALEALPEHHRNVLVLRYFEGLEEPEIAVAADIPRGTVKSRLHHAVRKMRDLLAAGAVS